MDPYVAVGLAVVCFVFGYIIGTRLATKLLRTAVDSGLGAGANQAVASLHQMGYLSQQDIQEISNMTPQQPKQQVGFNLNQGDKV